MPSLPRLALGIILFILAFQTAHATQLIKAQNVGAAGHEKVVPGVSEHGLAYHTPDGASSLDGPVSATQSQVSIMSTSVGELLRWPALPKYTSFQAMTNNEAYYRDAFTAITYTATATHDGQTWDTKGTIAASDGTTKNIAWPTLTFYAQIGGYSSCFYSPGWAYYLCGSNTIYITAYTKSQCEPYGNWTFSVYEDGGFVGQRSFTMLGEVPPEDLTAISQNSPHSYDSICYVTGTNPPVNATCGASNTTPYTIKKKGCALTSSAMVLNYHGVSATPDPLDEFLVSQGANGYGLEGNINWKGPPLYSPDIVKFLGRVDGQDDATLTDRICRYGPQVMAVKNTGHFVMVTGRTPDGSSWKIYDPDGGVIATLDKYGNKYNGLRLYGGQQTKYTDSLNDFTLYLYSPAELLVTAPDGKRTGFDPVKGLSYKEIPHSAYVTERLDDDETGQPDPHPVKILEIRGGAEGEYTVQVTGTGTGSYQLILQRGDMNGNPWDTTEIRDVPISAGLTNQYVVNYSMTSGSTLQLEGGFDGGGQRPADVNRFLRYSSPSASRTELPAGTTSFRVAVTYGDTTDPASFTATLNGADVHYLFSPQTGKSEAVSIPLASGSNTLVLSIEGVTASGRVATETDRLVFLVP